MDAGVHERRRWRLVAQASEKNKFSLHGTGKVLPNEITLRFLRPTALFRAVRQEFPLRCYVRFFGSKEKKKKEKKKKGKALYPILTELITARRFSEIRLYRLSARSCDPRADLTKTSVEDAKRYLRSRAINPRNDKTERRMQCLHAAADYRSLALRDFRPCGRVEARANKDGKGRAINSG